MQTQRPDDAAIAWRDQLLREERWMAEGDLRSEVLREPLLAVRFEGQTLFPAFQFLDAGIRHPRLAELLAYLPPDGDGLAAILWCFAPTRKLEGARPADLFRTDPSAVIDAAGRDFEGDNFDW